MWKRWLERLQRKDLEVEGVEGVRRRLNRSWGSGVTCQTFIHLPDMGWERWENYHHPIHHLASRQWKLRKIRKVPYISTFLINYRELYYMTYPSYFCKLFLSFLFCLAFPRQPCSSIYLHCLSAHKSDKKLNTVLEGKPFRPPCLSWWRGTMDAGPEDLPPFNHWHLLYVIWKLSHQRVTRLRRVNIITISPKM